MGVLEPVEEAFTEVPATPPGVRDLGVDDDLFAQTENNNNHPANTLNNEFFKGILPVLPYKGNFDFYGVEDTNILTLQSLPAQKEKKKCTTCTSDAIKDLKKLEQFVQDCKNETENLRAENENLKKELEELKKQLSQNVSDKKDGVNVSISNNDGGKFDVLMRKRNAENIGRRISDVTQINKKLPKVSDIYGVQSFSISVPGENSAKNEFLPENIPKSRKSVAQLRKEFFENHFENIQKTFTSRNYLEVKPEEKKDTFRSRLTIRVKPKPRIAEVISNLTSISSVSKLIPDAAPVTMFQRFEKKRIVWQNDFQERFVLQRHQQSV